VVQLQGRVRVVHHRARRRGDAKLARFGAELQEIENNLPIDPKFRNPKLGALAPIRVVNTCSRRATAIAACRPRPTTCRTTSASSRRRAPSA
jgi:hypothetical protein